jgi:hypothetical protein
VLDRIVIDICTVIVQDIMTYMLFMPALKVVTRLRPDK